MNTNKEQKTQIESNASRFPNDFDDPNNEKVHSTSLLTKSTGSSKQTHPNKTNHSSSYIDKETEKSENTEELSRWDDAWDEYEKERQQTDKIPSKDEKSNEIINIPTIHPPSSPSIGINREYVREFLPTSDRDPTFQILRNLFIRSFDEFYKQIETELKLQSDKTLVQWLDETFDEEEESILSGKYRCFLLCGNENLNSNETILGFLTLKEVGSGSVYIAQAAVRLDIKRRGFGAQLLLHLRNIFPPNTHYWGLCRRANRPALEFYLKQGAKYMKDDDVALKYGYDPKLYAGCEFDDTVLVVGSKGSSIERMKPNTDISDQNSTMITDAVQNDPNAPLINNSEKASKKSKPKPKRKKSTRCCVISWNLDENYFKN